MSDSEPKPERPKPEPKALTPEYHKARKQLMLWSAILFVWELVGIDLEKAKEAGGNTGALIASIKSPQAVPWALLILVGYFAFKLRIEWRQCSETRRQVVEAKQDYYLAFVIAVAACFLYIGQTIWRVQLADRLGDSEVSVTLIPLISVLVWIALLVKVAGALMNSWLEKRLPYRLFWLELKATAHLSRNSRVFIIISLVLIGVLLLAWSWRIARGQISKKT
jgi:hypothetical protein